MASFLDLCRDCSAEKALKAIKSYNNCVQYEVDDVGNTALICACIQKLGEVAINILKHPHKCKMGQVNNSFETALIWACKNNMEKVAFPYY
jgi:ankyrin repeat protein